MIPKKIYYVWVGNKPKPEIFYKCEQSWKKNLPDYDIVEINENNFDLDYHLLHNKFFKTCYERKMWAFVSDYIRVVHLFEHGGIYLDTDMEIIKDISKLIDPDTEFFSGFENELTVNAAIIGSVKNSETLKSVISFYNEDIWKYPLFTIPSILTYILNKQLPVNNQLAHSYISKSIKLFPPQYFYPYYYDEVYSDKCLTKDTYGIHWWDHSWKGIDDNYLFLRTKHLKEPIKTMVKIAIKIKHRQLKK